MTKTTGRNILILTAASAFALAACSQTSPAVKGFVSGPGAWQSTSAQTTTTSNVQYLGASMDGTIIVRLADGTAQTWSPGR